MANLVSVIIPHYDDLAGLDACLTAVSGQTRSPDEVIVADNNSPQGEIEVARTINGRAKLVIVREKGAGPARNGGVAASCGDILAFTDSDCVPDGSWLEEGLAALQRHSFVGGEMHVLVADEANISPTEAFERVFAFDNRHYVERKAFTVTANLICPRAVFDSVGPFRLGVPEDLDWCHRARDAGYRIGYAPRALVGHPARRSWEEITRKWSRLNEEAFGLLCMQPLGRTRWLLRTLALPASAIAHTFRPLTSSALPSTRDRLNALWLLYRLRFWRTAHSLQLLARNF